MIARLARRWMILSLILAATTYAAAAGTTRPAGEGGFDGTLAILTWLGLQPMAYLGDEQVAEKHRQGQLMVGQRVNMPLMITGSTIDKESNQTRIFFDQRYGTPENAVRIRYSMTPRAGSRLNAVLGATHQVTGRISEVTFRRGGKSLNRDKSVETNHYGLSLVINPD